MKIDLTRYVRDIPDFPKPGIVFKDITPLLADPRAFAAVVDRFAQLMEGSGARKVVGIESRGFIFGAALADRAGLGFVPVRKPGKLPYQTVRENYELEYGTDAVEMHRDAIDAGEKVVLVDDLLATGGTLRACANLVEAVGGDAVMSLVVIELKFLEGRKNLPANHTLHALIEY